MKWKKDNKLPNTKNVRKKNPDGSLVNPPPPKKSKRSQNKKQSNAAVSNEVSIRMFVFFLFIEVLTEPSISGVPGRRSLIAALNKSGQLKEKN